MSTNSSANSGGVNHNRVLSLQVICGRAVYVLILLALAVGLGVGALYVLRASEYNLAVTEYLSISERALDKAQEVALRKRLGTVTMASIVANHHPDAREWPFVTIRYVSIDSFIHS